MKSIFSGPGIRGVDVARFVIFLVVIIATNILSRVVFQGRVGMPNDSMLYAAMFWTLLCAINDKRAGE